MIFNNSQAFLTYLYALPKTHEKADLTYIKQVLNLLGNPQNQVKTIHVTGTNGKGSTSYYLSNLLQKAGQKTGLFISPYVFEFGERIQINGQYISESELLRIANRVEQVLAQLRQDNASFSLVTFEYEVVLAFIYFAQAKCDYAVIEVGIGGQHDKTNVIVPEVSIITTVGLDHEALIGPTIQDIAREKSGIIKHQRPVILGNVPNEVLPLIKQKALVEAAPLYQLGVDFDVNLTTEAVYTDQKRQVTLSPRPLVECYDLAVAIKAFSLLQIPLADNQIELALDQTVIPGRYQIIQNNPLVVLDGAHNIQAMQNLLHFVHQQQQRRQGKVRILIMLMRDKDLTPIFSLFEENDEVHITTIDYPRAANKDDFPQQIKNKYPYEADWQIAFEQLRQKSQPNDILLVTGSFYLVGNILQWEQKYENKRHK